MSEADVNLQRIIKEGRREVLVGCTACHKYENIGGVVLKKCGKCKIVKYCSVECQRADLPKHKNECEDDSDGEGRGVGTLLKSVDGNPVLNDYIQICTVIKHNIYQIPGVLRLESISTPFIVHIDVAIEACDITDWMNLYTHPDSGWDRADMQGMLQFHHMEKIVRPTSSQMNLWKEGRALADETNRKYQPVAVVSFVIHRRHEINCLWIIEENAIARARAGVGFQQEDRHTGEMIEIPLTVENVLNRMNAMARVDNLNELLLRTKMRFADKELIRDAGRPSIDTLAVRSFRLKISREKFIPERLIHVLPPDALYDQSEYTGMNRAQRRQFEREKKRGSAKRAPRH